MAVPIKVPQVAHPKSKLHHLLTGAKNQQYVRDHFGALKHSCLVFEHRSMAGVFHAIPTLPVPGGEFYDRRLKRSTWSLHVLWYCKSICFMSCVFLHGKLQGPRVERE